MIHLVPDKSVEGVIYLKSEPEQVTRLGVQYTASHDGLLKKKLLGAARKDRFACTTVISSAAYVMRGFYYQDWVQHNLLRCVAGRASIAVVDLRPDSITFGASMLKCIDAHYAFGALFIPSGCAYASLTLQDNTVLLRQMTTPDRDSKPPLMAWDSAGVNWGLRPGHGIRFDNVGYPDAVRYEELMARRRAEAA